MPGSQSDKILKANPADFTNKHNVDLGSMDALPESYAWEDDGRASHDLGSAKETVPIIDLSDPNAPDLMGQACRKWGLFQVTNHGVPVRLLEEVEAAGRSLFGLPMDHKLKAAPLPGKLSGYGRQRISAFFDKDMWSEGFTIVGSPLEQARQLWPQDYTKFCEVMEECIREMSQLAERILWQLLCSLGITKEDLEEAGLNREISKWPNPILHLNSYPPCPDPDRAIGLAAHTDTQLMNLVYQGQISGLQVLQEGLGWVTVPPVPGAIVVSIGDILHIFSNGLFLNAMHRAVVSLNEHRISSVYILALPKDIRIVPFSKLAGSHTPLRYRPLSLAEFSEIKTKSKGFNNAVPLLRA